MHIFNFSFGERIKFTDLVANLQCHNRSVRNVYSPSSEVEVLKILQTARKLNASVSVRGGGIYLENLFKFKYITHYKAENSWLRRIFTVVIFKKNNQYTYLYVTQDIATLASLFRKTVS